MKMQKKKNGYIIFKDKKIVLTMDIGESPDFKYSKKISIWMSFI